MQGSRDADETKSPLDLETLDEKLGGTSEQPTEDTESDALPAPDQNEEGSNSKDDRRRDENEQDEYSVKLKAEYIASERPPSLPPIIEDLMPKKDEGTNKKRPRDKKTEDSEKMCSAIIRGHECSRGDSCKYSHDIKEYLANRPKDIDTLLDNDCSCPIYAKYGYCNYGITCRFGKSHLNLATGENFRKESYRPGMETEETCNSLPKDIQIQLRKKKYPFKCERYDPRNSNKADKEEITINKNVDMTPLPQKRKLIDFSNKVYVAPLTTVGNLPFRRIMVDFGADITCGEMALASGILEGKPSEWALLKRHKSEKIFGVQLAAAFPDQFTRTCELIENELEVDFVDLNLGCPLDILCNKGAGARLMMRDNYLKKALQGISTTLSCPFTVKMRTGWDVKKPFAHSLVNKIQSWEIEGLSAIMVHGRSRLQRYSNLADWNYISQVSQNQSEALRHIPIIGNGDIFSYSDFEEKQKSFPNLSSCAMLGRGALIKPWLPTEIKERRHWDISASERLDILKDFVKYGLDHWGSDQTGVNRCRRFLLEWLSFLHRYVPVGLLEVVPQQMNHRPPFHMIGRNDLETLFLSNHPSDWVRISEMVLGPSPEGFQFEPKHKAKSFQAEG